MRELPARETWISSPVLKTFAIKVRHGAAYLTEHGIAQFLREARYQLVNFYFERRLGIHTANTVRLADVGIHSEDARDSTPIGYAAFWSILNSISPDPSRSVFLDYGVGKGRAVCAAATLPFRRILGVDISEVFIELAEANLQRMRHRRTTEVILTRVDAAAYPVPEDVNVIYFFNPFTGKTLRKVVENILTSFQKSPREIHIAFFNNDHFDKVIDQQPWLSKLRQSQFYPEVSCGVYVTQADERRRTLY